MYIFWPIILFSLITYLAENPEVYSQKTDKVCNCFSVISIKLIFTLIVPVSFMIDTHKKRQLGIETLVEDDLAQSLEKIERILKASYSPFQLQEIRV